MKYCLVLLCLLMTGVASAQSLPARFDVTDVAADDTLTVRQNPDASSAKIGDLRSFATGVEVLRLSNDGLWGRIGLPEGNGWVSMRYLEAQEVGDEGTVPRPLRCSGTEPFWSFDMAGDDTTVYSELGSEPLALTGVREIAASNNFLHQSESGTGIAMTLVATRGLCTNGMSDREFGFRANLFIEAPSGVFHANGCCTLDTR